MLPSRTYLSLLLLCVALSVTNSTDSDNAIMSENQNAGTTAWYIAPSDNSSDGDGTSQNGEIKGFAGRPSVNKGENLSFFISAYDPVLPSNIPFTVEIYRMGYYQDTGGRLMKRVYFRPNSAGSGCVPSGPDQLTETCNFGGGVQPICKIVDVSAKLTECPWHATYDLNVPATWTSGIYVAKLINDAPSNNKQSYIIFAVRDDQAHADFVYQQPVNTYLAYGNYPAKQNTLPQADPDNGIASYSTSLYGLEYKRPDLWAKKVSFNRPYASWMDRGAGYFFSLELNFIKFLEKWGYDVKYVTNLDTHSSGKSYGQSHAFITAGHDEYYTYEMFNSLRSLRDEAGTSLGFFGGNTLYHKARYETSPTTGEANRVLVSFKSDSANDPYAANPALRTGQFASVYAHEQTLVGTSSAVAVPGGSDYLITNPAHWVWTCSGAVSGTAVKSVNGWEGDQIKPGANYQPTNMEPGSFTVLSDSPAGASQTSSAIYRSSAGAWVFSAGTIYWGNAFASQNLAMPYSRLEPAGGNWTKIRVATKNILDVMSHQSISSCSEGRRLE